MFQINPMLKLKTTMKESSSQFYTEDTHSYGILVAKNVINYQCYLQMIKEIKKEPITIRR